MVRPHQCVFGNVCLATKYHTDDAQGVKRWTGAIDLQLGTQDNPQAPRPLWL